MCVCVCGYFTELLSLPWWSYYLFVVFVFVVVFIVVVAAHVVDDAFVVIVVVAVVALVFVFVRVLRAVFMDLVPMLRLSALWSLLSR